MVLFILVSLIFQLLTKFLSPLIAVITPLFNIPQFFSTIFAMVLLILMFFAIGVVVRRSHGKELIRKVEENYLNGIPLYSSISSIVKHFTGLESMPFSQVVLVDPYGTGTMLTGFVTEQVSETMYTIFVPTAPNPTNGNIYHVPFERLKFLNVSAEEAMKTVVSVGSGSSVLFYDTAITEKILPKNNNLERVPFSDNKSPTPNP
jgi:uncharacterized membrane protein